MDQSSYPKALDAWAYHNGVKLNFSRPGKPTRLVINAYIYCSPQQHPVMLISNHLMESLRDECLNTNWFLSIEDARYKLKTWQNDYNGVPPAQFFGQSDTGGICRQSGLK